MHVCPEPAATGSGHVKVDHFRRLAASRRAVVAGLAGALATVYIRSPYGRHRISAELGPTAVMWPRARPPLRGTGASAVLGEGSVLLPSRNTRNVRTPGHQWRASDGRGQYNHAQTVQPGRQRGAHRA